MDCSMHLSRLVGVLAIIGTMGIPAHANPVIQSVTPSAASPQPLGTPVTWQTAATDTDPGVLNYRYNVILGPSSTIVRDYSISNSFQFAGSVREGPYQIQVTVLNTSTQLMAQMLVPFQYNSLVTGTSAVVTPTANPLVALFSAPSCPAGSAMRVAFQLQAAAAYMATDWRPCHPPASMNFYMAGMLPNTTTKMIQQVQTGTTITTGSSLLSFHSGALTISVPPTTVLVPASAKDDLALGVVLHDYLTGSSPTPNFPVATDLQGNIMWYYAALNDPTQNNALLTRPLSGGTMLLIVNGTNSSNPSVTQDQILREIDLAGNTLRETNATIVGQQLAAKGIIHSGQVFGSFHHDAIRLGNGNTVVWGSEEQIFPTGTQGSTDPLGVDIVADVAVVLDTNWQVIWGWNAFDHMDIARAAVLRELCRPAAPGCPPLLLSGQTTTNTANDWLHGNSLAYIPATGDLLASFRHQDWVVKIDYKNGAGTGNVLWRLGLSGDFTMTSTDPYPWFSHQHDAAFENGGNSLISLFDNGNTRVSPPPLGLGSGNSRGQLLNINENTMQVSLQLNADLGVYGFALGSAQLLPNGNAHFQPGIVNPGSSSSSIEVLPNGTIGYEMQSGPNGTSYRSWRMTSLYYPPAR